VDFDFTEDLKTQMAYPLEVFWKYAFYKTHEERFLEESKRMELAAKAHACGVWCAANVKKCFPDLTGEDLLQRLGFRILRGEELELGAAMIFAVFKSPDEIYMGKLAEEQMPELKDIFLYHELYHGLEFQYKKEIHTSQKVVLKKIGPLSFSHFFNALSEIGAMAFAQEMVSLSYSPFLLDAVLTKETAPLTSEKIIKILDTFANV